MAKIAKKTLKTLEKITKQQTLYGLKKYGKELDPRDHYNWLDMAMEELADLSQYIQCEIERKKEVIKLLEMSLRSNNPKLLIKQAIKIMQIEGTGKKGEIQ